MTTSTLSPSPSSLEGKTLPEMNDAENLSSDLKRILVRSEHALIGEDARDNVVNLERWIESYRRGLSAAQKISENGLEMLSTSRDKLKQSLEEQLRLDDEGGNPPNKKQLELREELASAIRRIDRLIPLVGHTFQPTPPPSPSE